MTLFACSGVRRRLQAFYDRELSIPDQIAIESHVADCPPCASELRDIQGVGEALRLVSVPGPADDWTGLQSGVISRMRAEAHESLTARTRRMFDDMHFVWIGLAATVATLVCGTLALTAVNFASPEREDSLAAMIEVIAAPSGSDLNPVRSERFLQVPSVPQGGAIQVMLAQPITHDELVLALSAVVTRDGRVSDVSVLGTERHPNEVTPLLRVLAQARLEPGRRGMSPVAVNLVWLLAHTTVKAKAPRIT